MIKFTIITLFPELLNEFKNTSIIKKAIDKNKVVIDIVDLKEFGKGKRKNVDDTVYGGGTGMVIAVPVLDKAIEYVLNSNPNMENKIIYMSPKGKVFNQYMAREYASNKTKSIHYIVLCGHYEGIDNRIFNLYDITEISIGDYILTGGEVPAMVFVDSVTRLIDGVLKKEATLLESHSEHLLEEPQYTKPFEYKGIKVPEVLISGHHQKIDDFRHEEALKETLNKRPDLLEESNIKEGNL